MKNKSILILLAISILSSCNLFKKHPKEPIKDDIITKTLIPEETITEPKGLVPFKPFSFFVFKRTMFNGIQRIRVQLNSHENGMSFNYAMDSFGYDQPHGTIIMSKEAFLNSEAQRTNFNLHGDTSRPINNTTLFFSKRSFSQLKNNGKTSISINDREILNLVLDNASSNEFTCIVDNVEKKLPVIIAISSNPANTKRFIILDDPNFPMILSMNDYYNLELESAHGVGDIAPLFELKEGLVLHYEVSDQGINEEDLYIKVISLSDTGVIMNCKTYDDTGGIVKNVKMVFNKQSMYNPGGFISPKPESFETKVKYIYNGNFLTTMRGGFDVALIAKKSILPFEHFVVEAYEFTDSSSRANAVLEENRKNFTEYTLGKVDYQNEINRDLYTFYFEDTSLDLYPVKLVSERYEHILEVYPCTQFPLILHYKNGRLGLEMTLSGVSMKEPNFEY